MSDDPPVMCWVRRNGVVDGPFPVSVVADWVAQGMSDAAVRLDDDTSPWVPVVYSKFAALLPPPPPPSNAGRNIVIGITLFCLTLGGCGFIAAEPLVALAIFFVGIPFAIFMIFVAFAALGRSSNRH